MNLYAQTNIQLFNQLSRQGYSNVDLCCIANVYKLAVNLFTGHFRPSGKTFIAHLVGTASILANLHVSPKLVATGLLHAAYSHGDFGGTGKKGISPAKRKQVACVVGQEIEECIAQYTALKWKDNISEIHKHLEEFDSTTRDVLLIRLANELEEYNDLGILYCSDLKHDQYNNHQTMLIIEMAEKIGYPTLAAELDRAFQETTIAKIPLELRVLIGEEFSALIPPNSCRIKFPVWFYQVIERRISNRRSLAGRNSSVQTSHIVDA
ncbi:MAG: hypothetical protein HC769_00370 [Cyanobacteria bacterium CRU_2_1]|nr:hypothetical protein [Cyanobacteria bacterium RU_5_0]NJR57429.1 hypothetical protein [Cyanobacteria bacterium CRU_2_1]